MKAFTICGVVAKCVSPPTHGRPRIGHSVRPRRFYISGAFIAAVSLNIVPAAWAAQISYTVKQIESLPGPFGGPLSVIGSGFNDTGQVAGSMYSRDDFLPVNAFITGPNGEGLHLLGTLPGDVNGGAAGVNNLGQVAGFSGRSPSRAFLSEANGGSLHEIAPSAQGTESSAFAVNNRGQVTGYIHSPDLHAFLTAPNGGPTQDLGTLGGTLSVGYDVNDSGQVAGASSLAGGDVEHAFLSDKNGGTLHDLGTLGGKGSTAYGVNEHGQVVGYASLRGDRVAHAFLSRENGGSLIDLGTLGRFDSLAFAVNDSGVVVGQSRVGNVYHAFIYSAGAGMQDLNSFIDPQLALELSYANDVNERGQILATAIVDGQQQAFLLTPINGVVDFGSTVILLIGGLASLFGFKIVNRRSQDPCTAAAVDGAATET